MGLGKIHDCEKCHNKIVCISVDELGITRCGYCNEIVDYGKLRNPDYKRFLKRLK